MKTKSAYTVSNHVAETATLVNEKCIDPATQHHLSQEHRCVSVHESHRRHTNGHAATPRDCMNVKCIRADLRDIQSQSCSAESVEDDETGEIMTEAEVGCHRCKVNACKARVLGHARGRFLAASIEQMRARTQPPPAATHAAYLPSSTSRVINQHTYIHVRRMD